MTTREPLGDSVAGAVRVALAQLDELRLPLHILLDARFGELNENQEELLGAAQSAAAAVDDALRRLGQIADADRGALVMQRQPVQLNDVVRAVLPLANAAAARSRARVDVSLEPGLPRVMADRSRLAEALALLVEIAASSVDERAPLIVTTARTLDGVSLVVTPWPTGRGDALAWRLIEAQGGDVADAFGSLTVRLRSAAGA